MADLQVLFATAALQPSDMVLKEGERQWAKAASIPGLDGDLFSWWSVHFAADGIEPLRTAPLLEDARGAKECVVVSAYLAIHWLQQLLNAVPTGCVVRLHLNEGELKRKPTLRGQLAKEVDRRGSLLRVQLHQPRGGMFHTKLYAFGDGAGWTIWMGSANASMQAFAANEELMLRARGSIVSPLIGYLARLKKDGKPFKDASTELPPDDVRALLLNGRMYLRRDWASGLRLPIEARSRSSSQQKTKAPPGYVAPRGKSSFDVAAALGVKQRDDNRSRMKKLSVATCYGLWAPQALRDEIEEDRQGVQKRREAILARVWDANKAVGEDQVRVRFHDVLGFVTEKQWREPAFLASWKWNPDKAFRRFYDRLFGRWERGRIVRVGKLSPDLRARMADPLYSGIVPDVFSNEDEGEEFLASFFESLEVESYKTRSQNRIWHTIRDFCDLNKPPYTADDIRHQFDKCLQQWAFEDERWARRDDTAGADEAGFDEDGEGEDEDE
jgi:hypothetical protein